MAKAAPKIVLSSARDIPLDLIDLSQSNVRRVKAGVSIEALADDIARRGLLQSLNVRPTLNDEGQETGRFHLPAGGRRFRALELLVKRKRLAKNAPVPCIVKDANDPISAEEDSLAENTHREQLHPLDQFRSMKRLVDQGDDIEAIAATFMTTPAVVRQRLKLASVSPALHEIYAEDGMTLDQLMAFSVSEDHARQEQVWELLAHSWNKESSFIRSRLTENTVRASDKRVLFVGIDAYAEAGGCVLRDLFEADDGGWLQDAALLDTLVAAKLQADAERIGGEGWKWVTAAVDLPYGHLNSLREIDSDPAALTDAESARAEALTAEGNAIEANYEDVEELPEDVAARIEAIDEELAGLIERPRTYDPREIGIAGAFVSLDTDGSLFVERGWVRAEDEPQVAEPGDDEAEGDQSVDPIGPQQPAARSTVVTVGGVAVDEPDDDDEQIIKPLPDRLVSELTAHRTLALQDAFAASPSTAFAAVLHAMVLSSFYHGRTESCVGISVTRTSFANQAPGMKDSSSARSIAARHEAWEKRLPDSDKDLWDALMLLDGVDQAALFAHCAAFGVNALWEATSRYDGRVSAHGVERRLAHSHVLARAVGLDMVAAGWKPTVENYLGRVAKPRILIAVAEARDDHTAGLIDHLKKGDMAREAERLLADADWLPEPLRTPAIEDAFDPAAVDQDEAADADAEALPAFLGGDDDQPADEDDLSEGYAIAAE
ncbi:ParB/RepB/Spo0J family partition protein [Sandaracinobacter sp. RS1-74]|uniref:ParB/RepB/Spo0J family partition protein n=1 Tax=Sandaracinobacteroides sayramensis TaxID=2913411 RepID=UPI001EDC4EF8|nr:ParB/RepB/Spo0J family partition protein [Sandaracinobacteroides sayramensis]MCG2841461.1 ParB/RepB/Spo0J family partition protein [Sandaracinobacteroides sayramensis]